VTLLQEFYADPSNIYSVWTVTFRSSCTDSTGLVTTGRCQGYNGHEPLFVADTSQVRFSSSAYFEQERPAINVVRSFAGRHGNTRATSAADMAALALTLTPRNYTAREGTEAPRAIGMQVQQLLACSASGPGATFALVVVNDTVPVHSWYTLSDLQKALNPGTGLPSNSSAPGVTVAVALQTRSPPQVRTHNRARTRHHYLSHDATMCASCLCVQTSGAICGVNGTMVYTVLTFLTPRGGALPLAEVTYTPLSCSSSSPL
jgi:hypothetical protein